MRISTAIDLYAGGPGSGCNPEAGKCGRHPKEMSDVQRAKLNIPSSVAGPRTDTKSSPILTKYALEQQQARQQAAILKPGKKGAQTPADILRKHAKDVELPKKGEKTGKQMPARGYKKTTLTPTKKALETWRSKIGEWKGLSPDEIHKLRTTEEGDKAITTQKMKAWDERVNAVRTYKAGTPVTVTGVIPPVANNPPLFSIKFPGGGTLHAPLDNVFVTKHEAAPDIDPQDVRKSQIVSQMQTKDGAKYTVVKPAGDRDEDNGRVREHNLKGSFENVTGFVKGIDDPTRRSAAFFAPVKGAGAEPEGSHWVTSDEGVTFRQLGQAGTTVFIHRYMGDQKHATIQEINSGQYGHVFQQARTWEYKNLGSADSFLKKRYGISFRLRDLR